MMLAEWKEQFHSDGAHYEQSPMYHYDPDGPMLDLCLLLQAQGDKEHHPGAKGPSTRFEFCGLCSSLWPLAFVQRLRPEVASSL